MESKEASYFDLIQYSSLLSWLIKANIKMNYIYKHKSGARNVRNVHNVHNKHFNF